MGVGAGLYMCDVVKKFTFAISSPDEFLSTLPTLTTYVTWRWKSRVTDLSRTITFLGQVVQCIIS